MCSFFGREEDRDGVKFGLGLGFAKMFMYIPIATSLHRAM